MLCSATTHMTTLIHAQDQIHPRQLDDDGGLAPASCHLNWHAFLRRTILHRCPTMAGRDDEFDLHVRGFLMRDGGHWHNASNLPREIVTVRKPIL